MKVVLFKLVLVSFSFAVLVGCAGEGGEGERSADPTDYTLEPDGLVTSASWVRHDADWSVADESAYAGSAEDIDANFGGFKGVSSWVKDSAVDRIEELPAGHKLDLQTDGHLFVGRVLRDMQKSESFYANNIYINNLINKSSSYSHSDAKQTSFERFASTNQTIFDIGTSEYFDTMQSLVDNPEDNVIYRTARGNVDGGGLCFYAIGDYKYKQSNLPGYTDYINMGVPDFTYLWAAGEFTMISRSVFVNYTDSELETFWLGTWDKSQNEYVDRKPYSKFGLSGNVKIHWHKGGNRIRIVRDYPLDEGGEDSVFYREFDRNYTAYSHDHDIYRSSGGRISGGYGNYKFILRRVDFAPERWNGVYVRARVDAFHKVADREDPRMIVNAFFHEDATYIQYRRRGIYIKTDPRGNKVYSVSRRSELSAEDRTVFDTVHYIIGNRGEFNDGRFLIIEQ